LAHATARRDGMPRLESILLHSASGDGYNDLTPLSAIRRGPIGTERNRPASEPIAIALIRCGEYEAVRGLPQTDVELMAQKQVLGLKPTPRLEQIADEHTERVQDRKHRSE
jgi:hypothetical protein